MSRELIRKFKRDREKHQKHLIEMVEKFLIDAKGKSETEIMELVKSYDKLWTQYAHEKNKIAKVVTLYSDAFESSIENGWKYVKNIQGKNESEILEIKRIFDITRRRNLIQRILKKLNKYFFVKNGK